MKKIVFLFLAILSGVLSVAAESPAKLNAPTLMIGDSMMKILGEQMKKKFKKEGVEAEAFASLGSGLARPAAFNWTAKIDELMSSVKPKTVFVCIGMNDAQAVDTDDGLIRYGAPEWKGAYMNMVGAVMDQLIGKGAETVVWLLLPDMQAPERQAHRNLVNDIAVEAAKAEHRVGKVILFDTTPILSKVPGKYSRTLITSAGTPKAVRDPDGVHLTVDGSRIVADAIYKKFWK